MNIPPPQLWGMGPARTIAVIVLTFIVVASLMLIAAGIAVEYMTWTGVYDPVRDDDVDPADLPDPATLNRRRLILFASSAGVALAAGLLLVLAIPWKERRADSGQTCRDPSS